MIRIGTAGWNVPRDVASAFPKNGSHLERYGQVFPSVEINSSFYRPHRVSTYERWAASVPDGFRFAVKIPKTITHERRLHEVGDLREQFLGEVAGLGPKLGALLVQLPPSLAFETEAAQSFLRGLRGRVDVQIACEPRHPSWFGHEVEELLVELRMGRVAADPAVIPAAKGPGGWTGLTYVRLHGSPRIYHSPYGDEEIRSVVERLASRQAGGSDCWCIFDNTAASATTSNALAALDLVSARAP